MRRPDVDGNERLHVAERHVRRGNDGSGHTQPRIRVHGPEDGRTTVTLECPEAIVDVPEIGEVVPLAEVIDLPEQHRVETDPLEVETSLEEHETPTNEKLRSGHRDHAAFRKVRRLVVVSDLFCALLVLAGVLIPITYPNGWTNYGKVWVLPVAWMLVALVCSARSDRIEDLLDRRPYLKRNVHLTFLVVVVAVFMAPQYRIQAVLIASAVLAFCGIAVRTIIRWMLARGMISHITETVL